MIIITKWLNKRFLNAINAERNFVQNALRNVLLLEVEMIVTNSNVIVEELSVGILYLIMIVVVIASILIVLSIVMSTMMSRRSITIMVIVIIITFSVDGDCDCSPHSDHDAVDEE